MGKWPGDQVGPHLTVEVEPEGGEVGAQGQGHQVRVRLRGPGQVIGVRGQVTGVRCKVSRSR